MAILKQSLSYRGSCDGVKEKAPLAGWLAGKGLQQPRDFLTPPNPFTLKVSDGVGGSCGREGEHAHRLRLAAALEQSGQE